MGKIKKILENELVGGTQSTDVYPVTSVKAVYDENNERLDHILNRRGVVNISTNYNADHTAEVLTLSQAIAKVPSSDRVLGFIGSFLSEEGWVTYKFIGDSISDWNNTSKWTLVLDSNTLLANRGYSSKRAMTQEAVSNEFDKLDDVLVIKSTQAILGQWQEGEAVRYNTGTIESADNWKRTVITLDKDYSAIQLPIPKSNYGYGIAFFGEDNNYIDGYYNSTIDEGTIQSISIPDGVRTIQYSIGASVNVSSTEVTLITSKFNTVSVLLNELGTYSNSTEYLRAYTDKDGKFLWGITIEGDIEWSKGVPTPIQERLSALSKSIHGNTLSIDDLNKNVKEINNIFFEDGSTEYLYVILDDNDNILFGISADGSVGWFKGVPQPIAEKINNLLKILDSLQYLKDYFHVEESDDFIKVILDEKDRVLFGIKRDGTPYYPNNEMYEVGTDTEYLAVWTDAEDRVLFGIKRDGTIYPESTSDKLSSEVKELESTVSRIDEEVKELESTTSIVGSLYGTENVKEITGYVNNHIIAIGSVGIGGTINYTPEYLQNYHYVIQECKGLDKFYINGTGGNNPRLWAFIDSEDKIISMSASNATLNNGVIQAPINAVKIVINDNTGSVSYKGADNLLPVVQENTKDKNGILHETPDDTITAFINGIKFADELKGHLTDFKKEGDKMVHVSTFYIIDGVIYVTYYVNTRSAAENPAEHTARFVYCPQSNMEQKTYIDLCDVGDTVLGKTVTALYDIVMFKKTDNDDVLYLAWTVALDGEYYRVYRTYTISTGILGDILANTFTVGDVTNDFSISGMKGAMDANNITYKNLSGDIGLMQKLSTRVENGETYYYTGCYVGPFNCILKSKDLVNWIYVSQPTFTNDSQWENATYVLNDKVYYCVRQYADKSNCAFLTYYDLISEQWADPVYIYEAQSRYDFFEYGGNLYLIHSPKDRNHLAIMMVNKTYLNYSYDIQVAVVPNYFYPFVQVYGNDLYVSFTASRQHIYLSKVTLGSLSNNRIINKFREIFLT